MTPPSPNSAREEWLEPLVESVMAHKQSDNKYHWTACICCGRANQHLAPKIAAEAERQMLEKVEVILSEEMDKVAVSTNSEFIACDDLAVRAIKRFRALSPKTGEGKEV